MILKTKLFGHVYEFKSICEVMAKANEEKSGDRLAGIAAETAEERVAAKVVLANLTLNDLRNAPAVPYEEDEVTRIIQDDVNETIFREFRNMTVAEFREWLLDGNTTSEMVRRASRGITSEIVAGVCKLMSNLDLIYAAEKDPSDRALQHYDRPAGDVFLPPAAQPYDRRPERHPGLRDGGLLLRLRRCGAGAESGGRFGGIGRPHPQDVRRVQE